MSISRRLWARLPDGTPIYRYKMTNASGSSVVLANIGAGIVSINVPDKAGRLGDVVLGYGKAANYFNDGPCFGKCPGRVAGRIGGARFELDGREYRVQANKAPDHLHGGDEGFQNKVWESRRHRGAVEFRYVSPDGEMGYPGKLAVTAHYEWGDDNALRLTFTARCDAPTVLNLTNHAYFNLDCRGSVLGHRLWINSSEYIPTNERLIPLEGSEPVAGTPMDFLNPKRIGRDIRKPYPALVNGKGYDSCWLIDGYMPGQLQEAARLTAARSGRVLRVFTTQPALQVYTGNWLSGCPKGKRGRIYHDYDGVALECQHLPDSPNHPEYPSVTLRPGQVFHEAIIFAFSVE